MAVVAGVAAMVAAAVGVEAVMGETPAAGAAVVMVGDLAGVGVMVVMAAAAEVVGVGMGTRKDWSKKCLAR